MEKESKKSSILVVDDDPNFREIITAKLKSAGFEVLEANSGKQGLKKAQASPDLILLDLEMPEMSGVQVLNAIKTDPKLKDLKIVFLTNYGESSADGAWLDKKFANEIGAADYIRKTDDLDKIINKIKTTLQS